MKNTHQVERSGQRGIEVIFRGTLALCQQRVERRRALGYTGERIEKTAAYADQCRQEARKGGAL